MIRRLGTKIIVSMVIVAVVTAAVALPAAIIYTERRLEGLPADQREQAVAQIEMNSWADFDGLVEWGVVALLASAAGVGLGWLLARRITRPVHKISIAAHRLASGDLQARTGVARRDEIGDLANDFDAMAEALERLETDRRTSAASIAHELRTPVTILRTRLQAADDHLLELDGAEVHTLLRQLDGLTRTIDDLRILSLATAGRLTIHRELIDLFALATAQVASLEQTSAERSVRITVEHGPPLTIRADPDRIAQVLTNLVLNAIRHSPREAEVVVRCRETRDPTASGSMVTSWAELTIADSGPGFPDEVVERLFEPFTSGFVTPHPTPGSGLGLSIVRAIVDPHDGTVTAQNAPNGARVMVRLPKHHEGALPPPSAPGCDNGREEARSTFDEHRHTVSAGSDARDSSLPPPAGPTIHRAACQAPMRSVS